MTQAWRIFRQLGFGPACRTVLCKIFASGEGHGHVHRGFWEAYTILQPALICKLKQESMSELGGGQTSAFL